MLRSNLPERVESIQVSGARASAVGRDGYSTNYEERDVIRGGPV